VTLRGKGTLEDRQEEMRQRSQQQRNAEEATRVTCISCRTRKARDGSVYCSRCTASGMVNQLRNTLPGTVPPREEGHAALRFNKETHSIESFDPHQERTYSRTEVAEMLKVSAATIVRWEKKGVIPKPKRIPENNQCVYTKDMMDAIAKYKASEYTPPPAPGTPDVLPREVKAVKIDKHLEKAVARRLGSVRRLF